MATLALGGAVESQIPVVIDLTDDIPMVEAPVSYPPFRPNAIDFPEYLQAASAILLHPFGSCPHSSCPIP